MNPKYKFFLIALFLLGNSVLLSAQDYRESYGGQLRIGLVRELPLELNPFRANSRIETIIHQLAFKGYLFTLDADNKLQSVFIESAKKESDLSYVFLLKRSLYFQNGKPILSSDVKQSLLYLKKNRPNFIMQRVDFENIKDIQILGALSFKIILKKKDKNFYKKLANIPIIPEKYLEYLDKRFNEGSMPNILLGTGPFSISQINDYTEVYFRYHKNFYRGRSFLDQIRLTFYENQQQAIAGFLNNETDLIYFDDVGNAKMINQLMGKKTSIYKIKKNYPKLIMLLFNQNMPLFEKVETRKAIVYALNKSKLFPDEPNFEERSFFFEDGSDNYNSSISRRKYDPLKALSILKAAGWHLNKSTRILTNGDEEFNFLLYFERGNALMERIARNIQIQLGEIGINVIPIPENPLAGYHLIRDSKFSAILISRQFNPENPYPLMIHLYREYLKDQLRKKKIFKNQAQKLISQFSSGYISSEKFFEQFHTIFYRNIPLVFLGTQTTEFVAQSSLFSRTHYFIRKGNELIMLPTPFEDWFIPIDSQR